MAGVLLSCSAHQVCKEPASLAFFSIVQGPELVCREEGGYSDGSTPMRDSAVSACLLGCLVFPPRRPFSG